MVFFTVLLKTEDYLVPKFVNIVLGTDHCSNFYSAVNIGTGHGSNYHQFLTNIKIETKIQSINNWQRWISTGSDAGRRGGAARGSCRTARRRGGRAGRGGRLRRMGWRWEEGRREPAMEEGRGTALPEMSRWGATLGSGG
ncbi:hypothetical protein U9M48_026911 [Paspalum notatum var. saurae]|uniref:Uncharacterized protein n=1 Tax=Paspalum notatum var. saurae TaxID=547442 RepID=A0AAQ3WYS4_PASNO